MMIEKNDWIRLKGSDEKYNFMFEAKYMDDRGGYNGVGITQNKWNGCGLHYVCVYDETAITKAKAPQDLIEAGDLVFGFDDVQNTLFSGIAEINGKYIDVNGYLYTKDMVKSIFTPNKDGTKYTLQWEAE